MENKKLLKFLLKDLSELEELVGENVDKGLDTLELEFLNTRLSGAKKLVQMLYETENGQAKKEAITVKQESGKSIVEEKEKQKEKIKPQEVVKDEVEVPTIIEEQETDEIPGESIEIRNEATVDDSDTIEEEPPVSPEVVESKTAEPEKVESIDEKTEVKEEAAVLDEEQKEEEPNKVLGDSFSKEKSVNDLLSDDGSKLEHKLSNRPVSTIQEAIGINDRFQYIRELFEGEAELFNTTVQELDKMNNINEAVGYIQQNFKWKKNETSLKFVNLVKRRFTNG